MIFILSVYLKSRYWMSLSSRSWSLAHGSLESAQHPFWMRVDSYAHNYGFTCFCDALRIGLLGQAQGDAGMRPTRLLRHPGI
jgi:hypothetical protein